MDFSKQIEDTIFGRNDAKKIINQDVNVTKNDDRKMVEKESLPNDEVFKSDQKVRRWQHKRSPGWSGLTESHCHCHYTAIVNNV